MSNALKAAAVVTAFVVCGVSAGWVFRDARARGLSARKAATWAALQFSEWPLFLILYRRIRPRRVRS